MSFIQQNLDCAKCIRIRNFSRPYFLAFSPIAGKYGSEKLRIPNVFTQCQQLQTLIDSISV